MKIFRILLACLAVMGGISLVSAQTDTPKAMQTKERVYENEIPCYLWDGAHRAGKELQQFFYPDSFTYIRLVVTDGQTQTPSLERSNKTESVAKQTIENQIRSEKNFKSFESILFPDVYDTYFVKKDGKYGLISKPAKGKAMLTALPVYDKIWALYEHHTEENEWRLLPVFMVCRNRQYALIDLFGTVVTRFCEHPEQLKDACLKTESDQFNLKDIVPENLW